MREKSVCQPYFQKYRNINRSVRIGCRRCPCLDFHLGPDEEFQAGEDQASKCKRVDPGQYHKCRIGYSNPVGEGKMIG